MARRPLILVAATLVAALVAMFLVGKRVLAHDREALFASYAHERQKSAEEAARGLATDVADIGDDLELASTLLKSAETTRLAERELHAIATIKREYLVMYARVPGGETTKVTAFDAPAGVAGLADHALVLMLAVAESDPGKLRVSAALGNPGTPEAWYRVYARRPTEPGPIVAVVVDTSILLTRMKLQPDSMSRTAVLDARGDRSTTSDPKVALLFRTHGETFEPLLRTTRGGANATESIDGTLASQIGLPDAAAVAVAVPVVMDEGTPWTLLVIASTQTLEAQNTQIVRRVLVGGVLVLILLLSAAAYVLRNTYRARSLRERANHADRLAHLTEKAEKILDHIPSGVLALSQDLHVSSLNRWLEERLGREIVGRHASTAFPAGSDEDVTLVMELVNKALETRESQALHREHSALFGDEASLNVHAVPLARGIGDVSLLLVFDDVTELRRIEQRLLHSEKLVTAGQLAAGIAHEVGTPLNVARGRVELSLSHLGATHAEADNQKIVLDQIDRVTRLLQQLLDYVRPAPATIQVVDLPSSLRGVAELLAPQASKRNVSLHVEALDHEPSLRADPDQVQQIVVNLTLNAIDACQPRGHVWLRARRREGDLVLEIADDGHGIPRDLQKQVFDPFFTTKKRGQGTGLGLWVVAQLVRAQSAEIELDSTLDKGTTVRVVWPVAS